MAPLITIAIPTFNRPFLTVRAMVSVQAQTLREWEMIVVDDGSTDGTLQAAQGAAQGDPRITVLTIPHVGRPGIVKNQGIAAGAAPLVTVLDSDDRLTPTALEEVVSAMRSLPGVGALYTDRLIVGPGGVGLAPNCVEDYSSEGMLRTCLIRQLTVIRRPIFEALGGFGLGRFADDYDLGMRLSEETDVVHLRRPLYLATKHPGVPSVSNSNLGAQCAAVRDIQIAAYQRRRLLLPVRT